MGNNDIHIKYFQGEGHSRMAFKNPKLAHLEKVRLVIRSQEGQNHKKWVAPSCGSSTTGLLAIRFWGSVTKSLGDTRGQIFTKSGRI